MEDRTWSPARASDSILDPRYSILDARASQGYLVEDRRWRMEDRIKVRRGWHFFYAILDPQSSILGALLSKAVVGGRQANCEKPRGREPSGCQKSTTDVRRRIGEPSD